MRILMLCALAALVLAAEPVPDDKAKEAIAKYQDAFKAANEVGDKQNAVYTLYDVPNDLVLKELEKVLRNKDADVRHVAAMAIGGQKHNPKKAGEVLMKLYKKDFDTEIVIASALDAMGELKYMDYWPEVRSALKDQRNLVVMRVLALLGTTQDWRAFPDLVELYREVMPARISWSTGEEKVDTGASGDEDQRAAEAAFNKKYGSGGSKEQRKATAKAKSFDLRNFTPQIKKCVQDITGQTFDNAYDLEEWWCENYIEVAKKIAALEGKDPESVVTRAKAEQAELKAKIEEEREKMAEDLAKKREEENRK